MLTIMVGEVEHYDETKKEFYYLGGVKLELEHSLVSLSKWESEFKKPFLGPQDRTRDETLGYVRAMILTPEYPPDILDQFSEKNFLDINAYIEDAMTATWFADSPNKPKSREIITAELIYYWMITLNINWEAQHWHLNRLFTLIKVIGAKSEKPKKMSKAEIAARNRELNERRKRELGTSG